MFKTLNTLSIRNKAILIIVAVFASLSLMVLLITGAVLNQSFLALEKQQVERNIVRVRNGIQTDLDILNRINGDWAYWTETYDFVKGENDEYITDNLTFDTLYNLDVEMVIYYDEHNELIYATVADFDAFEIVEPDAILSAIDDNPWVFELDNLTDSRTGFIDTPDGLVMISSRHILTNDQEGPVEGFLLIGNRFGESRQQTLAQSINVALTAIDWDNWSNDDSNLPVPELLLNADDNRYITPFNRDIIHGYTLIYDQNDNPLMIVRTDITRQIYQQGQNSLIVYLSLLFITGIIMIVMITTLLNRSVLSRILLLEQAVTRIRTSNDLSLEIAISGSDEIGKLEQGIGEMVSALKGSRETLKRYNQELETKVAERTESLNDTVQQLEEEVRLRKAAEQETRIARDQALDALRLKTQILANVSHDARTPLTVIGLRVDMLARGRYGELTERQKEILVSIQENNKELLQFINNLLEQARTGETEITPAMAPLTLSTWVEHFTEGIMPLIERKNLSLTAEIATDMPDVIETDDEWLRNILSNLVNNAIKFTEVGGIDLRFYSLDEDYFAIDVADTGVGIAEPDLERIFEAFWQVDGSMTRKVNRGVGLGLSIVRNLTTLLGGEITVVSQQGQGTTFTVKLPLVIPVDERQEI